MILTIVSINYRRGLQLSREGGPIDRYRSEPTRTEFDPSQFHQTKSDKSIGLLGFIELLEFVELLSE